MLLFKARSGWAAPRSGAGGAWTCSSQPDLVSSSRAEGERERNSGWGSAPKVCLLFLYRNYALVAKYSACGAVLAICGFDTCVFSGGGGLPERRFASVCVCVCVPARASVCCERGNAEEEETLLVLHANDRFGCNKSLDVGLGKMI